MRDQFFGLSKRPINTLIKKMESDFSVEKSQLERELDSLSKEKENLFAELRELTEKNKVIQNDNDCWELGKERIEDVINNLNNQKELELATIQNNFEKQISPLMQQLEDIDQEMKSHDKLLNSLYTKLGRLVEQSQENLLNPKLEEIELIEHIEDRNIGVSNDSEEFDVINNNSSMETTEKDPKFSKTDSFWGNLEECVVDALQSKQIFGNSEMDFDFKALESKEAQVTAESDDPIESNKLDTDSPVPKQDHVLIEQIDSIKSMYIVGKLAGDDLFDQNGNLIISKYSLITKEVVDKANRAGKLAELIVNMKLSGMGAG
ncbi:MAG: hypothetical protein K0R71_1875 [Bacillales bacterium]|jgi:DNA repair exonuclease SbcCD ATPase subunit|nr:hypothetical protein [Bacillales bacterium]